MSAAFGDLTSFNPGLKLDSETKVFSRYYRVFRIDLR
jgi:hypothetical protein